MKTFKQIVYETLKLIVFACLIAMLIPVVHATIRTDLWLYSNFSLNANDSSGNNRHGINTGATMNLTGGKLDGAYKYTTDDKISYNGYGMLDNGDRQYFTLNVWVKSTRDDIYNTVWSEGCTSSDNCIFTHRGNTDADGKTETFMRDQAGTTKISSIENTRVSFNNTWNMITWVRNASNWRVHVNGIQASSGTGFNPVVSNFNTFNLGVLQRLGYALYYEGAIDEFGVWNRTFNQQDVDGLYNMYVVDGCNPINNATCNAAPSTQTSTPTGLTNTSNGITNITISWLGNYGSKYLIYRNGTNVVNDTASPYTDTGLTNNTRYGYKVKAYNTTYTIPLSNFSNEIEVRTRQTTPTTSLTLYTDIQNSGNYTMNPFVFRFNGTTNAVSLTFNCTLWINPAYTSGVYIGSKTVTDITLNQNITFDTTGVQATYDTQFLCRNSYVNNSLLRQFSVDTVIPIITPSAFSNNSIYYTGVNNYVTINLSFTDQNLYAINYTLCRGNGNTCANISDYVFDDTISPQREINVSNQYAIGDTAPAYLRKGRYIIKAEAWDSHTAEFIEDYDLKYISDGTKTGVKIDNAIEITSPNADMIELVKNTDRYNFDVVLKQPTDNIIFNLKSNGKLDYIENSEYLGHFVDFENKKWIDFENPNAESVTYTKISNNEYQVNVRMKPAKKGLIVDLAEPITFNSIGDLNEIKKYYYFNITRGQTFNARDRVSDAKIQNITVKVYTYPNTLIQTKSTTNYNVTFNLTSGTYYFNMSGNVGGVNYVTNVTANYTFATNHTKTVYLTTTNSFYIIFKDESTLLNLTGTQVHLDLISDSYSNNYSSSVGWIYVDDLASGDYTFRYGASGYHNRLSSYTLTQDTFNRITLYLLTGGASNVTLYVFDNSRQPVESAEILVYRYSVVDNAYIQVNTINTDYEGKAIIDAEKNTEFYRFYIYYNGDLKLSTQPAYITSSELVFTINTAAPLLDQFFNNEADYTYSCDYNIHSRNFKFYYQTNSEASQGCLYLYKVTPQTNTLYNYTCVSSGSSTILLTAANTSGATYTARGKITVDGVDYTLCTNSYNFINNVFDKKFGAFFIILFVILFAFIGFYSLPLSFILTPIPLVFGSGLGLIQIPMAASVGMCILGISLAVVIQKTRAV